MAEAQQNKTTPHPARNQATDPAQENSPPPALVAHWHAAGILPAGARWVPLAGGRTNAIWRVDPPDRRATPLVCKLFRPGGDTPLFANDPRAERLALAALSGTGLAPRPAAFGKTPAGTSLVYTHVDGRVWRAGDDPAPVAQALARLHAQPVPSDLPAAPMDPQALLAQTREMLDAVKETTIAPPPPPPVPPDLAEIRPVFLHGDATAGNALIDAGAVTFIDWQCPARGDPAEDLATFLSPAMQYLSGNAPMSPEAEAAFLAAYENPAIAARYHALAPLFHWRMAAYCLWRAARGDAGYAEAAKVELDSLR